MAAAKSSSKSGASPVILILNVVFALGVAVGAWFAAPAVADLINANSGALNSLDAGTARIAVTIVLFVLGTAIVSIVLSLFKPKNAGAAQEKKLAKEQAERFAHRRKVRGKRGKR